MRTHNTRLIAPATCLALLFAAACSKKSSDDKVPEAQKPAAAASDQKPEANNTPAAKPTAETVENALKEGQAVRHSWDEGPPKSFAWIGPNGEHITIELAVPDNPDETSGTLRATVGGASHDVTTFDYDVARGGSGFQLTALPSKQLEAIFEYGGTGAEPGTVDAVLLTWNASAKKLEIEKRWMGEETDDRPAWDKLAKGTAAPAAADPCYVECMKNGPDGPPGTADDWRRKSKEDQEAECDESCAGGEPPPVDQVED